MITLILELREHIDLKGGDPEAIAPIGVLSHYGFAEVLEFASKKKKGKKRNCKKGFPCGASCINQKKQCRNPLKGQAKTAQEWLKKNAVGQSGSQGDDSAPPGGAEAVTNSVKDADPPSFNPKPSEEMEETGTLLGRGFSGSVFRDEGPPPAAIKYIRRRKAEDFSGLSEEHIQEQLKENDEFMDQEIRGMKRMGELGVSPKLYGSAVLEGEFDETVLSMQVMDGYIEMDPLGHKEEVNLSSEDSRAITTSLLRKARTAHENNVFLDDVKADNVMMNLETKDAIFIDQGGADLDASNKQIAAQILDQFDGGVIESRPMLADAVSGLVSEFGSKQDKRDFKKIVKEFRDGFKLDGSSDDDSLETELFGAQKELTEPEYKKLIDRTYEILGRLGV